MPNEAELLRRIRDLEEQNSALQDKLDMIWSILAPEYDDDAGDDGDGDDDGGDGPNLVQISGPRKPA